MLTQLKRTFVFTVFFVVVFLITVSARIRHVPDEYATIQEGINDCSGGDTLLVQPGTYFESINFNGQNLVLASLFLTTGDNSYVALTIIDGNSDDRVITFENGENNTSMVIGFSIQNGYSQTGAGIYCFASDPIITNNIISNNNAFLYYGGGLGGGIYCSNASPVIINNVLIDNISTGSYGGDGAGMYCQYSNPVVINNTFYHNSADRWGGGIRVNSSDPIITNTIFWGNTAGDDGSQIYGESLVISYCDVYAGWEGEGNINANPEFRDPENGDFHLMATYCGDPYDSPCIDMGHPDILDSLLDCDWGLGELRSDIGAYGGGEGQVGIDDQKPQIPNRITLLQNYPNPFNAATTICYTLLEPSHVTIDIYDLLGRKVTTLIDEQQSAGYQQAIWNAENAVSGMYFYKISTGDYTETRKMLLLK